MIAALRRGLALTSPPEALAVLLGVVYVLLILKRKRLGWIATRIEWERLPAAASV